MMTILFETSRPFQARPGRFVQPFGDKVFRRVWWLWFSIAVVRLPMQKVFEVSKKAEWLVT